MPRTLECTSARHCLGECEIVTVLRRQLERQKEMTLRACDRIYLAHEVLGNLAEKQTMAAPQTLPDLRQRNASDCATACWRIVYSYHFGRDKRVRDLSHPINGTDPATIEAVIRADKGWHVRSGESFVRDLQHYADTWRPSICLMTFPGDSDSHYVTVAGVYRGRVHFQCPATGAQSMLTAEFEAAWHGLGRFAQFRRWSLTAWPKVD